MATKIKRGTMREDGLVFCKMSHGKEWWITPEQLRHKMDVYNDWKRIHSKTPKGKEQRRKSDAKQNQKPHRKTWLAEHQRKNRHIYSPRQKAWRKDYKKMRRTTDPFFRLKENIGSVIRSGLKYQGVRKSEHVNKLLGCSYDFFRGWLENQFTGEMCWQNYGPFWHVDHVLAINLFVLENREARHFAYNYRNCRPLSGPENLSKGDKLDFSLVEKYNLQEWLKYIKPEFLQNNLIPFPTQKIA